MTMYHLLASAPFASPLNAAMMRSLGRSRAQLTRAGYALNGTPLHAKVTVSEKLFGHAATGFENFFANASTRASDEGMAIAQHAFTSAGAALSARLEIVGAASL